MDPIFMFNCHCRDCQRALSSAYFPSVVVPKAGFSLLKGNLKYHSVTSESGNTVSRGFCADCGSFVAGSNAAFPDLVFFSGASLDDPSRFQPSMDIFVSSAQSWDHMNPDIGKVERMFTA
jgi:hypothetical protein